MTATLGGLIKDYRLKKRLSQRDISLKLGWKDTSRLSKIEQGRVGKPTRQTINRIIKALNLNENEIGHFLLVGGYVPTDTEIQQGIELVRKKIDTWQYPAYLQDFSFRFIYCNDNYLKVLNLPLKYKSVIEKEKPNVLKTAFDSRYVNGVEDMLGQDEKSLIPFKTAITAIIKNDLDEYQNESWYKNLLKELSQYDEFRDLWPKVDSTTLKRTLTEYDYEHFIGEYNGKKQTLKFHILSARFVQDPRFCVLLYFPADKETEKVFSK